MVYRTILPQWRGGALAESVSVGDEEFKCLLCILYLASVVETRGPNAMLLGARTLTLTCEAKATSATGNYAVVFGYQDAGNYYYMNFDGTSGNTKLYKVVGGAATAIATVSGTIIADTNAHQIKITRIGRSISVWYDGQSLLSNVLDDTFIGGQIGLGARTGLAYFDNVTAG
jgi:hypothetical protein